MRFGYYTFHLRATSESILPPFKGSTLRGALGHSLKKTTCALRKNSCHSCLLRGNCGYSLLFEPQLAEMATVVHRPHPYVLRSHADDRRTFRVGDTLSFSLLLFGTATTFLPHLIYAIEEMGRRGIGKQRTPAAGRFVLDQVLCHDREIYHQGSDRIKAAPIQQLDLRPLENEPPADDTVTVTFQTPLRLKFRNGFQDTIPFHLLMRAALRRCSSLEQAYGNGEPDLDYRGIIRQADQITVAHKTTRWQEVPRYSNRQQKRMSIGGVIGKVTYQGPGLQTFLPFLRYCAITHLGKQTSFGLGRIGVETGC